MRKSASSLPAIRGRQERREIASNSKSSFQVTYGSETRDEGYLQEEESDTKGSIQVEEAQFEAIKSIVLREEYLQRLKVLVKRLTDRFLPEISDVMDLLRHATVEVIQKIVLWRKAMGDKSAPFLFQSFNYLSRIPSDLDFLHSILILRQWIGFSLLRNPFLIPYPMKERQHLFTETISNPKPIESGKAEAFQLSGPIPSSSIPHSLTLLPRQSRPRRHLPSSSRPKNYLLNEEMKVIRSCERILLHEEDIFGLYHRDPSGHCVPLAVVSFTISRLISTFFRLNVLNVRHCRDSQISR